MKDVKVHDRGGYDQSYLGYTIDQMIKEYMDENKIDGLQMAIVQAPYIPRVVGYGLSDIKAGVRKLVGVNTMFALSRISVGYNSVALIQAHEKGILSYNDKVTKYLKLPKDFEHITLLDLMQQTSGIRDFREAKGYDSSKVYTAQEILSFIEEVGIETDKKVLLSPSNTYLIALVIEKTSGMSYESFVRKNQLDYLGLKNTYFYDELSSLKFDELSEDKPMHTLFKQEAHYINPNEIAKSYVNGNVKDQVKFDKNLVGFADLFASAQDVSTWDIALAGVILTTKPEDAALIYKPIKVKGKEVNASGGWQFSFSKGFMDIYGSTAGFSAYLSRFTDISDLICVTLLANKPDLDFTELARNIANAYKTNLGIKVDYHVVYAVDSYKTVKETYDALKENIKEAGFEIFSEINHKENAIKVKEDTSDDRVIIFGNAKIGTHLINENESVALQLPIRVQVYEDKVGRVWVTTTNLQAVAKLYNIQDSELINNMWNGIKKLINKSIRVY